MAIEAGRSFTARDVILTLQYLFAVRGAPEHLGSDNGPEFIVAMADPRGLLRERNQHGGRGVPGRVAC